MKHVSILIPLGHSSLSNIEGTYQILNEVNNFLAEMGKPRLFDVQLVGLDKTTIQKSGLFTISPDVLIDEVAKTDLIIIPAMYGNQAEVVEANKKFIPWVLKQREAGAEVVSFCIGSFFLASTGLLKGKQCATHWRLANEFRTMFPDVNLVDEKIMTEEDGIYTSGGAYAYLNLLLYLIEKYAGRAVSIMVAKSFMIDIDRDSQSPFIMFRGQKEHEDDSIKKAQEFIESNFRDKITVEQLADMFCAGPP
jgi:transcriptional regulator GlxA family with amidase domain